jgi:protoheme IX farnesyltransferase
MSVEALGSAASVGDYLQLLKPRVMSLVVFTAFVGLISAPGTVHPWVAAVAILCILIGAGAAGALNMWYDADIDGLMARTALRPVPQGRVKPGEALAFGLFLAGTSVFMLGTLVNWTAAGLLAFTIFFYVAIYTMWLKRRTVQNIVIGGAAGAFPPMIGWTAVTGSLDLASLTLFLVIFVWTPPHFWALSLYRTGDYARAGVPMLPVVAGTEETRRQILIYSVVMLPVSVLPAMAGVAGWLYAGSAILLSGLFLVLAHAVKRDSDGRLANRAAKRLFGYSLFYLFALFLMLLVERGLGITPFAPVTGLLS